MLLYPVRSQHSASWREGSPASETPTEGVTVCQLCTENNGEMIACQDCGCSICFDVSADDDVTRLREQVRRAYVTESGDVFCSRCGPSNDQDQDELDSEEIDWFDVYPERWYDEGSDLDELEDTAQTRQIGPGTE